MAFSIFSVPEISIKATVPLTNTFVTGKKRIKTRYIFNPLKLNRNDLETSEKYV